MDDGQNAGSEIQYREYMAGDEKQIIDLFNFVFQRNVTLDRWRWEFKENPVRRLDIILAFSDSRLVGMAASVPLRFSFKKTSVQTTRIQNVMVHPDHQGKGIFTITLQKLTDYFYSQNLDLVVTFPNNNSLPAFIRKLDCHFVDDIFTYNLPIALLQGGDSGCLSIYIEETVIFTESDRNFINLCLSPYDIFNSRDLNYLHWKFNERFDKNYRILRAHLDGCEEALIVFKYYPDGRSVDLVEFFIDEKNDIVPAMLKKIQQYYRNSGISINSFNIWSFPHYKFHDLLIESGFQKSNFSTHVVSKSLSQKTLAGYDKHASYYLSMGDSDVY